MASSLKTWRQERRQATFWSRARERSELLPRGELLDAIDTTLMMAGRAISQCRNAEDADTREVQLFEARMNMEAGLGMLDNLMERRAHAVGNS